MLQCYPYYPVIFAWGSEQIVTLKLGKPSTPNMPKNHYVLSLLEKSFAQMNVKLNISYSVEPMNTKRVLEELKRDGIINFAWLSMSKSKQAALYTQPFQYTTACTQNVY